MNEHEVEELLEEGVEMWVFFKSDSEKTERIIKFLMRKNFLQKPVPERLKKIEITDKQKLVNICAAASLHKAPNCTFTLEYRKDVVAARPVEA